MVSQAVTLKLPFKISTNEIYSGTHWSKRAKYKDMMLWSFLGVKSQLKPVDKCKIYFEFKFKNRPLDCSNCSYLVKLIEDCLTHYKIITDDNYKIVQEVKITSAKGEDNEVIIYLEEL